MDLIPGSTGFLAGGGEVGARLRRIDFSRTPLGPPDRWPQSLKTVVRIMLDSRYAMWMLWGPAHTFFCNDAYLPTVGIKRDWVLGAPADEVWKEIWPEIGPRIRHVLDTGEATWDEGLQLFLERSGYSEETYHTFSYSPLYDDGGLITGMLCVVTEVTERVISDRRLAFLGRLGSALSGTESEEQISQALAGSVAGADADLPFAAAYLFCADGRSARRVAHSGFEQHPSLPEVLPIDDALWPLSMFAGEGRPVTASNIASAGARLPQGPWAIAPVQARLLPLRGQGQAAPTGFLLIGLNPYRPFDESYEHFLDLVGAQIAAGLAAMHALESERQRVQALAELDRAKTDFFANVSHEFRTPLTLMLGPLEDALSDASLPALSALRDSLALAQRNALRLLKLVNSLLDFSRLEARRAQANVENLDLPALTADLASVFRAAIERAGLRFVVDCPPVQQPVRVDREMWEKILLNLLSNAFKHTLNGEIRVALRIENGEAMLTVSDTGTGIAPEMVPHLFKRFYRIADARARTYEGTGIGLALVNELVKLHGGRVEVSSEPGKGSQFTVRIPASFTDTAVAAAPAPTSRTTTAESFVEEARRWLPRAAGDSPEATGVPSGILPVVMLADDNADMRDYLSHLLEPHYTVVAVRDGEEALAALHARRPDLLLTDVMMPRMDGFALLRQVRADPTLRDLPVIMLSARAGEEARVEGLEVGADDYLVKPFAARELLARVNTHITMSRLRRDTESALREADRRFRVALEASPLGFVLLGAVRSAEGAIIDFRYLDMNGAAAAALRRSRESLVGRRICEVFPRSWSDSDLLQRYTRVVEGAEPVQFEVLSVNPGVPSWFQVAAVRHEDGLAIWFSDINEREQLEQELRDIDRRKDEFLATLAHELRNPLAPIRHATAIASTARDLPASVRRSHEIIDRQVRHMSLLLDDLLDISRITNGKLQLRRRLVAVSEIIDAALEASRPAVDARGHELRVEVEEASLCIDADPVRMAQVLSNLLNNAAKYTPRGGHLRLVAGREGKDLMLRVIDDGAGIAREAIPGIFAMFSQGKPALDRAEEGLGIGLALVKGLVELHGGEVTVRSEGTGRGAEFSVRMPLAMAPVSSPARPPPIPAPDPANRGPRRVLVADDNRDAVEMLQLLLQLEGHDVRVAYDGDQALNVAAEFRPELALLDIGMPGRNGYQVARDLRSTESAAGMLLIALTGWGQGSDRARALEAGFDHHLTKPVNPEVLQQLLATLTRRPLTSQNP
ncbi:MAG: ATP-binding protein [Steroidobacteraceae bacterium]